MTIDKLIRNKRPLSPIITQFEFQTEKIKQIHIVAFLTAITVIFYLFINFQSFYPEPSISSAPIPMLALFFLVTVSMCLLLASITNAMKGMFGSYGRFSLLKEADPEKEVTRSEYHWVRSVCQDYPDLRDLVKGMENENGNQTCNSMFHLWQIVGYRDLQKIDIEEDNVLKELPFIGSKFGGKKYDIGLGITVHVAKSIFGSSVNLLPAVKYGVLAAIIIGFGSTFLSGDFISEILASPHLINFSIFSILVAVICYRGVVAVINKRKLKDINPEIRKMPRK